MSEGEGDKFENIFHQILLLLKFLKYFQKDSVYLILLGLDESRHKLSFS